MASRQGHGLSRSLIRRENKGYAFEEGPWQVWHETRLDSHPGTVFGRMKNVYNVRLCSWERKWMKANDESPCGMWREGRGADGCFLGRVEFVGDVAEREWRLELCGTKKVRPPLDAPIR